MCISFNKTHINYAFFFLLLLFSYITVLYTNQQLHVERERVANNATLIKIFNSIKVIHSEADLNTLNYILSKKPVFKNDFIEIKNNINQLHIAVYKLVHNNTIQSANEILLQNMTYRRLLILNKLIFSNISLQSIMDIRGLMERLNSEQTHSIHRQIEKMIKIEMAIMQQNIFRVFRFQTNMKAMTFFSLFMTIAAILYVLITYNIQYKQRTNASSIAEQCRKELQTNIEQLKIKNIELKELEGVKKFAAIGRVSKMVAHEIRNPLTNIGLATEQLKDIADINKISDGRLLLNMINRNSARIGQMVTDLLNATKLAELNKQRDNINDILDEALLMAKDRLVLKKIKLIKSYSNHVCEVMIDKNRIKLAFSNIIINAIEAMEDRNGILRVSTWREKDDCIVEIQDNGNGMDEVTLNHLFEPYFTLKKKGNGLGLTNAQNIILSHKGNINISSEWGKGTVFRIALSIIGA